MRPSSLLPRLTYVVFSLCFLGSAVLTGQKSAEINSPLPGFEAALNHFEESSYRIAAPIFSRLATDPKATAVIRLRSQAYAQLCAYRLRVENRTWEEAEEVFLREARAGVLGVARQLRALRSENAFWKNFNADAAGILARTEEGRTLYEELLDAWASSTDLIEARTEYLRLVRTLGPAFADTDRSRTTLRQAVQIAQSDEDIAYFNLELARVYAKQAFAHDPENRIREGDALERAVSVGAGTTSFASALWELGQWAERYGKSEYNEVGQLIFRPDFTKAKLAYRKLVQTTPSEWAGLRDRAQRAIERMETPDLEVLVSHAFRPETEVQFAVRWRNLEAPTVEVYRVNPLDHGLFPSSGHLPPDPLDPLVPATFSRRLQTLPELQHYPIMERVRLEQALPPGAYVVVARSGEETAFAPLFVTDLVILSHQVGDELLYFVADADDGEPRPNVDLSLEFRSWPRGRGDEPVKFQISAQTNDQGIWRFDLPEHLNGSVQRVLLATSSFGEGATALYGSSWRSNQESMQKTAYVVTDRAIYRPGETVRLVGWLRQKVDHQWALPDLSEPFNYTFRSLNGEYVKAGVLEVNANASFVLDVVIPADAPLGTYDFGLDQKAASSWPVEGFSLSVEEYRTPDIEAKIELTSSTTLYPGDEIEGAVQVDYYAGGAVEEAEIELVVRRRPFVSWINPPVPGFLARGRDFYPSDPEPLQRLTLMTDARGRAAFSFRTERDPEQDYTYTIEARVRDLSRRETVTGTRVHVTQQAYFAELVPEHHLLAPGDAGRIGISLRDANDQPVSGDGTLRIMREQWREIYVHRKKGSEISGAAYRALPDRSLINAAQSDYRLLESGFTTKEIIREDLTIAEDGKGSYVFNPPEAGYYVVEWISRGERGRPITAETPLWVSDETVTELGYRPGGVQLIADKGPFSVGEPISVMIAAPAQNRWALLSISASGSIDDRIIHLNGSSRLITLIPTKDYIPNVFLDVSLISNEAHLTDSIELSIPPVEQYLDVLIETDQDGYEPGDEAVVQLRVRDAAGQPVETELAFIASDEALDALVEKARKPVVEAFYGDKNQHRFSASSSLRARPFFQPLGQALGDEESDDMPSLFLAEAEFPLDGVRARTSLEAASLSSKSVLSDVIGPARIRSDFRSTLAWFPQIKTDAEGKATVQLAFPDNLTAWSLQALVVAADTRIGENKLRTTTRLPLVARMQTPRFLVEGDSAKLSGIIQNNTKGVVEVAAQFEVDASLQLGDGEVIRERVQPGGLFRAEWDVAALAVGEAALSLGAVSGLHSDGVERRIEIVPHGLERTLGVVGYSSGGSVELNLDLPDAQNRKDTKATLKLSTTYATQLLDALPYLIEFPYGCTEQTLGRFLPSVAVMRTAEQLAVDLEGLDAFIFGGLSNEAVGGRENFRDLLDEVIADGIGRMEEMQLSDGSWPWMTAGGSDLFMTAYAVWSLTLAEEMGLDLQGIRLDAARDWLERQIIESELSAPREVWVLLALSSRYRGYGVGRPSRMEARSFLGLMNRREDLPPMNLAMLAMSAHYFGFDEDADIIIRNLANTVEEGSGNISGSVDAKGAAVTLPTAFWGRQSGYLHWSEGAVETTAWVLSALLEVDPENRWIGPTVAWLSRNRTGTHWQNTRATSLTILAISDYLRQIEAAQKTAAFSVLAGGKTIEVTSSDWVPAVIELDAEALVKKEVIAIAREDSKNGFNFELSARFYDQSESVSSGSSDLSITRTYVHLKPVPTLLKGVSEVMMPLDDNAAVASGDRVEVVLRIEAPRDMSYVLIEDPKPAGFEAIQVLSGPTAIARRLSNGPGQTVGPRQLFGFLELRDKHIGFLFDRLPQGVWEIRYRLRAESPGHFRAQPATVAPMYLNHVFGNSAEWRLEVKDAQ